jgi:hypothetical protein
VSSGGTFWICNGNQSWPHLVGRVPDACMRLSGPECSLRQPTQPPTMRRPACTRAASMKAHRARRIEVMKERRYFRLRFARAPNQNDNRASRASGGAIKRHIAGAGCIHRAAAASPKGRMGIECRWRQPCRSIAVDYLDPTEDDRRDPGGAAFQQTGAHEGVATRRRLFTRSLVPRRHQVRRCAVRQQACPVILDGRTACLMVLG